MSRKITLWSEFKRQGGWLLQTCTTDLLREIAGIRKKKPQQTRTYYYDGKPVVGVREGKVTYYIKKKPRR